MVLNPVRQLRPQRRLRRSRVVDVLPDDSLDLGAELSDLYQVPSPDQLDLLYLQYESNGQAGTDNLPSDEVSNRLMQDCEFTFTLP